MIALHTVSSFQKNEIDVNKNEHFIGPGFSRHLERTPFRTILLSRLLVYWDPSIE
jgi:hypothetical protein